jgi:uncharacterized protein (TIGR01319 family)
MSRYLMIDFGSTFTKLVAVDTEKEDIIATASSFTTVATDITIGYENALAELYEKLGEKVEFEKIISCSSAAGGLKMCAIGLIPELTVSEAKKLYDSGIISGGMIPKVDCCIEAINEGVKNVVIMDGRVPHSILMELLTDEGAGTMVTGNE